MPTTNIIRTDGWSSLHPTQGNLKSRLLIDPMHFVTMTFISAFLSGLHSLSLFTELYLEYRETCSGKRSPSRNRQLI